MAWTNIDDTFLEPGKPVRSADLIALRDNPIAVAAGAAGAPKITTASMTANSINGDRLAAGTTGAEKFQSGTTERNWVLARTSDAALGAVGSYVMAKNNGGGKPPGSTVSGSSLSYAATDGGSTGTLPGTWLLMGSAASGDVSTFLRIS